MFLTPNFIMADGILRDNFSGKFWQIPRKMSALDFLLSKLCLSFYKFNVVTK